MKTLAKFIFICLLLVPNFSRASEEFDPLLSGGDDELALMREQLNADNPEIVSAVPSVPPEQSSVSPLPAGGTQPLLMPTAPEQDFDFFMKNLPKMPLAKKFPIRRAKLRRGLRSSPARDWPILFLKKNRKRPTSNCRFPMSAAPGSKN